jgi:hypothetical protein
VVRTQVYLTDEQRDELAAISDATGESRSALVRRAVDMLIGHEGRARRDRVIRETAGMWKDRTDLPVPDALRDEWDRD